MTRLYKHLRVHQIFGANTDVGKTILTTALCRTSALARKRVFYLKPVSTGPPEDADDGHVKQFMGRFRNRVQTHCLFRYNEPVSPHLAAKASENPIPRDAVLVDSIASHIDKCARTVEPAVLYLETAGGPHSPIMSGSAQVDAYRPLLLPTILVGDPKLGGISSTISAYESLLLRGYRIDGVAMFRDAYYRNYEYLRQYFEERNISFTSVPPPPNKVEDLEQNYGLTEQYYCNIVESQFGGELQLFEDGIEKTHLRTLADLESMATRTLDVVWWPFVQHGLVKQAADVTIIDSAFGDHFSVYGGTQKDQSDPSTSLISPKFDGSASWWTQALGHGNSSLALAAAKAAGRYGHVMFPQASHAPALRLAERLVHDGPGAGWASRAYFSDDGSTGMEVALKMALRAFAKREAWVKNTGPDLGVIGIKGSYHGDTIGAMDACEEGIFTCEWHNAKGFWFDPPTVGMTAGQIAVNLPPTLAPIGSQRNFRFSSLSEVYDVERRLHSPLAGVYRKFISRTLSKLQHQNTVLSALVLEPLIMGAGGMVFVDPLFQRILVDVVRTELNSQSPAPNKNDWKGVPVIFDEVFVGLYRIGMESCWPLLGVKPDIAVYAKILTGGLVPMSITLASNSIFEAFQGETKAEALLHGHSYTAHPVGCEVANETLDIINKMTDSQDWVMAKRQWETTQTKHSPTSVWSFWDPTFIDAFSMKHHIQEVMTLGTVLAFKVHDNEGGYGSGSAQSALAFLKDALITDDFSTPFGVNFRTLGNVAYFMCSLNTNPKTLRALETTLLEGF